jgi:hypothetical protein
MCHFCEIKSFNIADYIQSNQDRLKTYADGRQTLEILPLNEVPNEHINISELPKNIDILISETNPLVFYDDKISNVYLTIFQSRTEVDDDDIETPINYRLYIQCLDITEIPEIITDKTLEIDLTHCEKLVNLTYTPCVSNEQKITIGITQSGIKKVNVRNIEQITIYLCNELEQIDNLSNINNVSIDANDKLRTINTVQDVNKLSINACYRLISCNTIYIYKINSSNLMLLLNLYRCIMKHGNKYYMCNKENYYIDQIYYDKFIKGLNRLAQQWKLRKFVKLCESREFNEYFYHPQHLGGQWHFNSIKRMTWED